MPRHQFRLFGNLEFLQSIDKVTILSRCLAGHGDYFARQGLDLDRLTNDEACARQLLKVFTTPDERMPGDLLRDLYALDNLANEDGHERIMEEADRLQIDLEFIPADVSAGDFTALVLLRHPRLIKICNEKTVASRFKRYYEYRSRESRRFELVDVEAAVDKSNPSWGLGLSSASGPVHAIHLPIRRELYT